MAQCWRSFLCLFAQEHSDFRLQELLSLASLLKCELKYDSTAYSNKSPFLIIQLQSEYNAKQIASRALLIRSIIELWGWGKDYHALESSIGENISTKLMEPYTRTDYSFKVLVGGYGGKCSLERQKFVINEKLSFLPFNGKVDLHNPQHIFHVLEDYEGPQSSSSKLKTPLRIFFGRLVAQGQRHLIQHYSVKRRHFIGNTSMDAQLSLIMANQAKVKPGNLVYDPFAGTGSLMVACAHFGGYVLGGDIDCNLLHGRGLSSRAGTKYRECGENVLANLTQYGLERQYIDMLVVDAAKCVWKSHEIFDAIVTDPPYGIREGARKIGVKKGPTKSVSPEMEEGHIPAKCTYRLSEVFLDLLKFAARCLVLGGRLVYWLPMLKTEFSLSALPTHPCLKLVSHSEQPLQRHISRWLITMEKYQTWSNEQHHYHKEDETSSHQQLSEERTDASGDLTLHDNFRMKYFSEERER